MPKPAVSQDKDHKAWPLSEQAKAKRSNANAQGLELSKQRTQSVEILINIRVVISKTLLQIRATSINKGQGKTVEFTDPACTAAL